MGEATEQQENSKVPEQLRPWQFKPGQSGNPSGRPKGAVSLKEYAKKMLYEMDEEERLEFMRGMDKKTVWEMAEGKAKQDTEITGNISISQVLDTLETNGSTTEG